MKRLKLGGGGQVLHMGISNDGVTKVVGSDAGGALVWNNTTSQWDQLLTTTRTPAGDFNDEEVCTGTYGVAVAPSDSTRIYLLAGPYELIGGVNRGHLYVSSDSGATFTNATGWGIIYNQDIATDKFYGPKIAVDPANKDVLFWGIPATTATVTISNASPAVVTASNNFTVNQIVVFTTSGSLPTGITAGTPYYVLSTSLTTASFRISATPGGTAINTSSAGSGTHTMTTGGLYKSVDGGATVTLVTSVPYTATAPRGIAFDPSSAVTGGKTQGIYLHSAGSTGAYHSTDGGATFSLVAGGPADSSHGKCGIDGAYYVLRTSSGNLWRLVGSTWTDISPVGGGWQPGQGTICPSLTAAGTLYATNDGGYMHWCTDANTTHSTWTAQSAPGRTATDVPWLQATSESYMTVGDWVMDPVTANKIWFCEGIGVWYTIAPQTATTVPWISQNAGIEELVTNQVMAPPGGNVMIANWDRPIFTSVNPNAYPTFHGPSYRTAINYGFSCDWATTTPTFRVVLANATVEDSSYSTDSGLTWSNFAALPPSFANQKSGGCIAASSTSTIVWEESGLGDVYYTRNGGTSWTRITGANWGNNVPDAGNITITAMADNGSGAIRCTVSTSLGSLVSGNDIHFDFVTATGGFGQTAFGSYTCTKIDATHVDLIGGPAATGVFTSGSFRIMTGWHISSSFVRQNLVADRVATDTFYIFNSGAANNTTTRGFGGGFFKISFPGGTPTFTRQSFPTTLMNSTISYHVHMAAAPNNAGHVFWTSGEGQSYGTGIQFSQDGCATWRQVPNSQQTRCLSLGATKPGNDYPSVYFVGGLVGGGGYGSQEYGIYRSDSSAALWAANTPTWTLVDTFPLNMTSQINTIAADADVWGQFYVGTPCNGVFYYDMGTTSTSTPVLGFSVVTDSNRRTTRMIGY